jgi:hypothetical protein
MNLEDKVMRGNVFYFHSMQKETSFLVIKLGACHLCDEQLCLVAGSGEPINPLR